MRVFPKAQFTLHLREYTGVRTRAHTHTEGGEKGGIERQREGRETERKKD